jgi:GntR family transcriptional regulator
MIRPLNKHSAIPLYSQLYARLVEQISSGQLKTGDRLPPERELAEAMNVSRITARQAIDALVDKGLVYRERGRGTFVAEPKMRGLIGFTSFSEDMRTRGYRPSSQIIAQELTPVEDETRKTLKMDAGELAIRLERVRLADETPVALQSALIPSRLCPGLENEDLRSQSLYSVLREKYGIYPTWTEAELEAIPATAEEACHLHLGMGDPVLIVRGITFSDSFEVIESVRTVYRGKGLALYIGRQRISAHQP